MDVMDMSPLPHKPSFNAPDVEIHSPTLDCSPMDTPVRPSFSALQDSPLVAQKDGLE